VEIEWLDSLESRVRDAVARLGEMKEENQTLRERLEELETRLATTAAMTLPPAPAEEEPERDEQIEALRAHVRELERSLAAAQTERAEAAAAAKSWEVEREEVRRRVEALTGRLEGLVE
jgi:chromosome segregation ATPase